MESARAATQKADRREYKAVGATGRRELAARKQDRRSRRAEERITS